MKKTIASLLVAATMVTASAGNVIDLRGVEYQVDTLYHATIGPGTTQTSLWLHSASSQLRVFYCTVDMTNPYVKLHGVVAKDKLAGNETISGMAKRKDKPGERYFAGINADFFATKGSTGRGVSMVGSPVGSTVVKDVIFRARNGASTYKQFIVDQQGNVYVDPFTFGGKVKKADGTSATLGGINAPENNNKITIFNDLYYGSTNLKDNDYEVAAVLAEGQTFKTAGSCKMVVTAAPSNAGDMTIEAGHYVLHGKGTASEFIASLKQGDTITVSPTWTANGVKVNPTEVVSGNPKILGGGEVLDSEADRGDASSLHPRSAIGYGDGGNKVYFMVVDGRSAISAGVRTSVLGAIMKYAGATDAMNVDGGGSSCLYTSALGVRNKPSDGNERADGNAFFATCTAPDDNTVAAVKFVDWKLETPKYGIYTPQFYGYNQYGILVDTDLKGVKLSCPASIGHVREDGAFVADGEGYGLLTATFGGSTATLPVTVGGSTANLSLRNDSVINDGYRRYAVEVQNTFNEKTLPIDPAALTWSSSDEGVVTIGANDGILKGVANGEAKVTGTLGDFKCDMKVMVEKPAKHVMPIDPNTDPSTWTFSISGGANGQAEAMGDGLKYSFTGKSSRLYYMNLNKKIRLWSLPDTLRLRLNTGGLGVKSVAFTLRTPGSNANNVTITPENFNPNAENVIDVPTALWADATDMATYPISLSTIRVNLNKTTAGQQYTLLFNGIEAVYNMKELGPTAIETIDAASQLTVTAAGGVLTFSRALDSVQAYDLGGRLIASAAGASQLTVGKGAMVVVATIGGKTIAQKLVVR